MVTEGGPLVFVALDAHFARRNAFAVGQHGAIDSNYIELIGNRHDRQSL